MQRLNRAAITVGLLVGIGALIWMVSSVLDRVHTMLVVIIFSILFSYLIYPAVVILAARMPRALAVAVVYLGLLVVVLLAGAYLAPTIVTQANDLAKNYPATVANVQHQIANPAANPILARFPAQVRETIAANAGKAGAYAGIAAGAVGAQTLVILQGGVAFLTIVALVFGLTTFLISDLEQIQETFLRMVPANRRTAAVSLVIDIDRVIGGFVRGQVLLAVIVGVVSTLILVVMGVQYAVLLGVLTGIVSIVPIVGAIVGVVPAFLVAVFTISFVKALVVLVLFIVVLQVQANVLAPLVVSRSVGVTPLIVFVAIIVGSEAYGILGTLLSIPIAGIIRVVYDRLFPFDPSVKGMIVAAHQAEKQAPPVLRGANKTLGTGRQ